MTSPSGPASITPNPAIHVQPSSKSPQRGAPFSAREMEAIGTYLIDSILAKVLLALSGITVFGIHPFAGLATWANNLETAANNALTNAGVAQGSANTANSGVAGINAYLSGTAIGGIHGSDLFPGSSSSSLGSNYDQHYSGSGAGTEGLSGSGQARWHASGLIFGRMCVAVRNDVTFNADQQKTWLILTDVVDYGASVYLMNRVNVASATYYLSGTSGSTGTAAAGSCGVFAVLTKTLLGANQAQIGWMRNGSVNLFGSPVTYSASPGDVYGFQTGVTSGSAREYVLQHNGNTLIDFTESVGSHPLSCMGSDYRGPAFAVAAGGGLFGEVGPPDIESFTWCDAA
jgi:hypothetical protein